MLCILWLSFTTGDSKSEYNIPIRPTSIFTDDIDLDDDKDIIIGHITGLGDSNPSVTILKNDGQGYFSIFDTSITYLGSQYDILSNDLYGDGYPEIVTIYSESDKSKSSTYIRTLNLNSSGVISYNDYFLSNDYGFSYKTYGDANGNNHTDIIIASYGCKCWGILYNQGQGNFSEPDYFGVENHPTDIKCGDLNNDEKDDIVVGGGDVNIYFPTDSGFEQTTIDNGSWHVFIDDFDNDGDNDIVGIDGMYTWNYFSYIENTGNGNFIQHPDTTTHPGGFDFSLTDMDNDGLSEILCLSNTYSGIYIFYNKGNFHLGEPVFIPVTYLGEDSRRFHCDDLDNNGFNDIIIVRRHGSPLPSNLIILFNDGEGNFLENPTTGINKTKTDNNISINCYPNPFINNISFDFIVPEPGIEKISVFDITGKFVINPVEKRIGGLAGTYIWNGLNKLNQEVNPGIYFVEIILDNRQQQVIKIIKY